MNQVELKKHFKNKAISTHLLHKSNLLSKMFGKKVQYLLTEYFLHKAK